MPSPPAHPVPPQNPANPWLRTVILHHQVPPSASTSAPADHYDWLIETPAPPGVTPTDDDRTLICFRSAERPDQLIAQRQPFTAERIADHRRLYLHFEGELSHSRGTVTRVAQGTFRIHERNQQVLIGEIDFAKRLLQNPTQSSGTGVPPVVTQPRSSGSETGSNLRVSIRATRTSDHAKSWTFTVH